MQSLEQLNPQEIREKIAEFIKWGPENGINNFIISGPVRDVPIEFTIFAGLYPPHIFGPETACVIVGNDPEGSARAPHYHSRILQLRISERIKRFKIRDIPVLRRKMEQQVALNKMPCVAICVGQTRDTKEEVVLLAFIEGMSPETALKEFQDKSKNRLVPFN